MYILLLKNFFDRLLGVAIILVFLPLLLILTVLIKTESRGPAFYKQIRTGLNGIDFTIYKLRSMFYNPEKSGTYFTNSNDSRITRIGQLLRKSSLDEIPQAFNLILGDMSLIGPRPDLPIQKSNYTENEWALRNKIKPGITGLAQALKRSNCTEKQRKKLDLFYVKNMSLGLDIYIIYKTFIVLFKRGVQN